MTQGIPTDPRAAAEVFYDGGCPICRREIATYRRLPGLEEARWTDVTDSAGRLPAGVDRDAALARFHVRRRDGEVAAGFAAFVAIWRAVPRLRWVARVLDRQPFLALGEAAYRGFLAVRPLWRRRAPTRA